MDTAFEFVPLTLVFERRGEDDLNPLFVGVLGGGRTVVDLGVAGGIEVVVFELELELELEDQVPARVSDDVVWFVEEEEDVGCVVEVEACVVEEEVFILEDTDPEATPVTHEDGFVAEEDATLERVVRGSPLSVDHGFAFTGGAGGGGISVCDADFVCGGGTKV